MKKLIENFLNKKLNKKNLKKINKRLKKTSEERYLEKNVSFFKNWNTSDTIVSHSGDLYYACVGVILENNIPEMIPLPILGETLKINYYDLYNNLKSLGIKEIEVSELLEKFKNFYTARV